MYVYNHRFSSIKKLSGTGGFWNGFAKQSGQMQCLYPEVVETIYSWRTGKSSLSDVGSSKPSDQRDDWGIRVPSQEGNLVDRLTDRKRYYEEMTRAAFPAETATGSLSTDRVSLVDSGHPFTKVTGVYFPITAKVKLNTYYYGYDGDVWAPAAQLYNASGRTMSLPTTSFSMTTSQVRQNMLNGVFKSISPDKDDASLMVTLIELLRGDIPKLIGDLQRFTSISGRSIKDYKQAVNSVGDQYLNSVFGWTPLVKDLAKTIQVLLTIDRMVYAESFRRKRDWQGPTDSSESAWSTSLGSGADPVLQGSKRTYSGGGTIDGSLIVEGTQRITRGENYHLSSRISSIAKPNSKTIGFVDQANEILQRLGFVTSLAEVWELVPYSWLVDWVSNIGASIHNANVYSPSSGKYTVDFAYLTTWTSHTTEQSVRSARYASDPNTSWKITRGKSFLSSVTKWRERATPFGFGTQLGSLSAGQFAILTALGLARLR